VIKLRHRLHLHWAASEGDSVVGVGDDSIYAAALENNLTAASSTQGMVETKSSSLLQQNESVDEGAHTETSTADAGDVAPADVSLV